MLSLHLDPSKYTIVRVDGKSFSTYTRGFDKPFDAEITFAMQQVAQSLVREVPGSSGAYVASDEVSLVVPPVTDLWFGGREVKWVSLTASIATATFNDCIPQTFYGGLAYFDSRVFQVGTALDVADYLETRVRSCSANALSAVAQSVFSHRDLLNKGYGDMLEMLESKGIDYLEDYEVADRRGSVVKKVKVLRDTEYFRNGEVVVAEAVERTEIVVEGWSPNVSLV